MQMQTWMVHTRAHTHTHTHTHSHTLSHTRTGGEARWDGGVLPEGGVGVVSVDGVGLTAVEVAGVVDEWYNRLREVRV